MLDFVKKMLGLSKSQETIVNKDVAIDVVDLNPKAAKKAPAKPKAPKAEKTPAAKPKKAKPAK